MVKRGGGNMGGVEGDVGEWTIYYDDSSTPFWYNNNTGDSVWEKPEGAEEAVAQGGGPEAGSGSGSGSVSASAAVVEGGGGEGSGGEWQIYQDDNGADYWYNNITQESTYDDPSGGGGGGGGEGGVVEQESVHTLESETGGEGAGGGEADASKPWETYYDESGSPYYYHTVTGESTYDLPY